jgi:hypothetical protein
MTPKRQRRRAPNPTPPPDNITSDPSVRDVLRESPDYFHSTPTPDERREAELIAELENLGYAVSVPCTVCGHPLTNKRSTSLHIGPVCRGKAVTR